MRLRARVAVALLYAGSAVACSRPPPTKLDAPAASAQTARPAPPIDLAPRDPMRRPVVILRSDDSAWLVDPDEGPARGLDFKADPVGILSVQVGTGAAHLSADGRWMAYFRERRLWIRDLSTGVARKVDTPRTDKVRVLISAWSPDSRSLLFNIDQIITWLPEGADDGEVAVYHPWPKGLASGFYVARPADEAAGPGPSRTHPGADIRPTHVPNVRAFDAWSSDSEYVIYSKDGTVVRAQIASGKAEPIRSIPKGIWSGILGVSGDRLTVRIDGRIETSRLDGTDLAVVEPGPWPLVSPDGGRAAFPHQGKIRVVNVATKAVVADLPYAENYAWESATTLLYWDFWLHDHKLVRVRLDGSTHLVADDVTAVIIAGG